MTDKQRILLVGDFSQEHIDIRPLCQRFDFAVMAEEGLDTSWPPDMRGVVAGFIEVGADGLSTVRRASAMFPDVLWIACCRFSSPIARADSETVSAFHLVHLPFDTSEVVQSLSFVEANLARRRVLSPYLIDKASQVAA